MTKLSLRSMLAGLILSSLASIGIAQESDPANNPDPVFVFNRICYAQVPDVYAIQTMATKLAWRSMSEQQVDQFDTYKRATFRSGWEVQVGERLFQVGVTQAPVSDQMLETFPGFAKGNATTCSIVLDDQHEASEFMANMQKLAGKEPVSRDVPEGLLNTTTWAGGNDELKVFLFAKAPATGKGGLLNVTILQKSK